MPCDHGEWTSHSPRAGRIVVEANRLIVFPFATSYEEILIFGAGQCQRGTASWSNHLIEPVT
jgi:hypothetical protein